MSPPKTMKAVRLVKHVGKYAEGADAVRECVHVVDEPVPKPKWSQVLIRVQRATINPSDTSFLQGRYGVKANPPCAVGLEGCGVVVGFGGSLLAWRLLGKRVSFFGKPGAWAEYIAIDQSRCLVVGEETEWKNAAAALANPLTVLEMVRTCELDGHKALVATAGASSIALQLVRVAKAHGIASIAIVRKADQLQTCLDAGAAVALDSSAPDFEAKLQAACQEHKAKIAFDSVAGEVGGQVLSALLDNGTLYVYGFLSGKPVPCQGKDLIFRNKQVRGLNANHIFRHGLVQLWRMTSELVQRLNTELATEVRETFPLDRVVDALMTYTAQLSGGKVQLLIGKEEAQVAAPPA